MLVPIICVLMTIIDKYTDMELGVFICVSKIECLIAHRANAILAIMGNSGPTRPQQVEWSVSMQYINDTLRYRPLVMFSIIATVTALKYVDDRRRLSHDLRTLVWWRNIVREG